MLPKGFHIYGSCFHDDGAHVFEDKVKGKWNPRQIQRGQVENSTHFLISELDMLRKGSMFIGTIHSNVARLVHFLRYPHFENTYTMLPRLMDGGLENLYYYY